jgi:acetyltransferase-like isoleucine patch superfamily enzyme
MRFLTFFFRAPLSKKLFFIRKFACKLKSITVYQLLFKNISSSAIIIRPLHITHEYVSIGNKVKIWHDARIEGVEEYLGKSFAPEIILEDGVEIQQRVHITAASKLIIGSNTSILPDVLITDIDHSFEESDKPKGEQSISSKPTFIGSNCSIGAGTKILAGTNLGAGCVVGANSVVRGAFPPRSVIAGAPAKLIRIYDLPHDSKKLF